MFRIINMYHAQEIRELCLGKYKDLEPSVSLKFDNSLLSKSDLPLNDKEIVVEIQNIDTITATINFLKETNDNNVPPLILNMANHMEPGGGFLRGAAAQEEDLFRCTNLFRTLNPSLYPIEDNEVIYTPKAHILRDAKYNNIEPLTVSFISVAGLRYPVLTKGKLRKSDYVTMKNKIKMIYRIGQMGKHDTLILGALGCGVFRNPPEDIAKIFCEVTRLYQGVFKKIIFPILCPEDNDNCEIFQRVFSTYFNDPELEPDTDSTVEFEFESDIIDFNLFWL